MSKWYSKLMKSAIVLGLSFGAVGGVLTAHAEEEKSAREQIVEQYPSRVEHEGEVIDGSDQTLKIGIVSDASATGILNMTFFSSSIDADMISFAMSGAFPADEIYRLRADDDSTPIKITYDEEAKTVKYNINPDFKWSNGDPVTTADIYKTYELVANKEFIQASGHVRFGDQQKLIVGMEEYNEGKSDTIEGIEIISDSEMIFHLKEFAPTVLWGGPFMYEFVNAKQLEGIPYDEIMESDAMRKNPLSYGPYFVTDVVPGESISWEANPYYYKGEPKVKYATTTIIPVSQEIAAARAGNFDLMFGAGSVSWPEYQELTNYSMITTYDLYMNYVGFRVGEMDNENHVVVTNPDAKMNDPQLKRAMKLALDMDSIGEVFYHGLRFSAKTFTAPMFEDMLHDPSIEPIGYDEEAAEALLEEAGYVDTDGDGFREDKEGNPLEINFAFMSGGDIAEQLAQYYIQQWGKIGLNVKLVDDRLLDQNNFYDRMENDDPAIDVYVAGFGFASDPNPSWFLGESAGFNLARYTSDALQGALDKINSQEALGDEKMQQFYYELEKVFFDELPIIPLQNRVSFIPVNKRVKVYESRPGTDFDASMIELTAKEPIAE